MKKKISILFLGFILAALFSVPVMAEPEKTYAFVCPVITSTAVGEHNPKAVELGTSDTYTVTPPTGAHNGALYIPKIATNMDGAGVPGGPQSQPGDTDYTAIWAVQ